MGDEIVERVAVALSMADPDERGLPDGVKMAPFYRGLARAAIAAHIAALSEAGYAIVPREPTEEMLSAAWPHGSFRGPAMDHFKSDVVDYWNAMIAAAPKETP